MTFPNDLIREITGCPPEDVKKVEFLMRERSPILGELRRPEFARLALESYEVLQFIRVDNSRDSVWLRNYVNSGCPEV